MRIERDSMGEMTVPDEMLYGAQTARAVENFSVSGMGIGRDMIRALGQVKAVAASVNRELGLLDVTMAEAIEQAAREVADGKWDEHFPVDVFQTGSGTSSNMNVNEVIARRAEKQVHPNDHVNLGQSSNDVFPTAIHLAAVTKIEETLLPVLGQMSATLAELSLRFDDVITTGRTHLQDATPVRLGQVFSGYQAQVDHGIGHLQQALPHLRELPIGGTAVGTGVNTHPRFGSLMAARLSTLTGHDFIEAPNHFEAQSARDAAVQMSGALKTVAVSLMKIANDIRHLGSGPRLGLGELDLPAVQPGSSIMPGKVNPVIAESLIMVCAQVLGNDAAISLGGLYGNFQLNVMMPLIARNLLEQIQLLSGAGRNFDQKLLRGLQAKPSTRLAQSLALATALAPKVGYDLAAEIAKEAHASGQTVREVALARKVATPAELDHLLDPVRLTKADQ